MRPSSAARDEAPNVSRAGEKLTLVFGSFLRLTAHALTDLGQEIHSETFVRRVDRIGPGRGQASSVSKFTLIKSHRKLSRSSQKKKTEKE